MFHDYVNGSAPLPVFCYPVASYIPFAKVHLDEQTRHTVQHVCAEKRKTTTGNTPVNMTIKLVKKA
jgi:hypothetical protein